ncbi:MULTISPECIES: hypothetical protein [unclassified Rhodococcus (in: high G+C Gram-positive bacteria)]|uniref:hypothetical protein n=1 Tax=unclassified Rhodococcus (in: high G+C Gram-positive bacteria) TaxID=192944 RepID=UPI0012E33D97|nr:MULTISPECIES: hypothetical protein [unclassified Rhodococcus (in: high G+C Gram-positive bacteria)]
MYRPTDIHPSGALARAERRVVGIADAIVATSRFTLDTVVEQTKPRSAVAKFVLENGVDANLFESSGTAMPWKDRRGFVYVGAIDTRFDWNAVISIAETYPNEPVTLVGPLTTHRANLPSNIACVGAKPYLDTPKLLSQARVGLLPFNSNTLNAGRSPMKFYEYLSAGLAVAGTRTTELSTRNAPLTWLWEGESDIALQAGRALAGNWTAAGVAHAREFDWDTRADQLKSILRPLVESKIGGGIR